MLDVVLLVSDVLVSPVDAIVRCINQIAHMTGKETVAEFVGTEAVESALKEIGVDYSQGFLRHRPVPIDGMFSPAPKCN